jgi:hypothetical protein
MFHHVPDGIPTTPRPATVTEEEGEGGYHTLLVPLTVQLMQVQSRPFKWAHQLCRFPVLPHLGVVHQKCLVGEWGVRGEPRYVVEG